MKLILGVLLFLTCNQLANAQDKPTLPFDDRGKFIHYEVVELKATPLDSLKSRMVNYLKQKKSPVKLTSIVGDTAFTANGKFIINKTLLVMSHPSGEVYYQFKAEIRDHKYRFWLTDFTFIPYVRDRYSNFVPATTVATPLEKIPGKLDASQWKEYQSQTAAFAKELGEKFKSYLASKSVVAAPAKKKEVITKSW